MTPLNLQLDSVGAKDQRDFTFKLDGFVQANVLRDLAGQDSVDVDVALEALPTDQVVLPPDPVLDDVPDAKPVRKVVRPVAKKQVPKTVPVQPVKTVPEVVDSKEDVEPTDDEKTPPAGYKANPFD